MRIHLPVLALSSFCLLAVSCRGPKAYTTSLFEQQTATHKIIAVLPAEMVFTGIQSKTMTAEAIAQMEEVESRFFQNAIYNSILRYADTRKYYTTVFVQDISTTQRILEENQISIRDSWIQDDKELARLLRVDAVVRMRVMKKRYMSDLASMGIGVGQQILSQVVNSNFGVPRVPNKTADLFVSCNLVSDHRTLWNDSYRGSSNYAVASETVVDNIADYFGRHFPYKRRR
jgi:hypothetical protein